LLAVRHSLLAVAGLAFVLFVVVLVIMSLRSGRGGRSFDASPPQSGRQDERKPHD
jgi:hypothetical protein